MAKLTDKLNTFIHPLMIKYVMHQYDRKSRIIEKQHPELFAPVSSTLSKKHRELWARTGLRCSDRWLRFHVNLTGIEDYTFCPPNIFYSRIERVLNDCNQSGFGPDDKCNLFRYVPVENVPETVLTYVRGSFFNGENLWVSRDRAANILEGEFVGKPCRSSGGAGVEIRNDFTPEWIEKHAGETYVVQKKIEQCDFAAQFNEHSINTVRVMTLRCPWNGKLVVCRSIFRMGVCNAVADNMSKGGLCVCLGDKGQLGKYAHGYNGEKFERHPVCGLTFGGMTHPGYAKMVETAFAIHSRILEYNLLSFDLVQRKDGTICVVEINATSQGTTQLQYDFGGLFGEHTEQVVDWCASNIRFDTFNHFRTWY